jgi:hypothetical protein
MVIYLLGIFYMIVEYRNYILGISLGIIIILDLIYTYRDTLTKNKRGKDG